MATTDCLTPHEELEEEKKRCEFIHRQTHSDKCNVILSLLRFNFGTNSPVVVVRDANVFV